MKQSVTKSAKKTSSSAVAGAPPAAGGMLKTLAKALARKIAATLQPELRVKDATIASGKPPARKPATTVAAKATGKVVPPLAAKAKPAPKRATGTAAKLAQPAKVAQKKAVAIASAVAPTKAKAMGRGGAGNKQAATRAVSKVASKADTGAVAGVVAELADKIENSVVSKVSEVMTKTTKPTPAANTENRIITEDEIRLMSEKDYMNPAQLAFFKARLQQLEKDLLKNAGETTEHLRETVLVPDPADRASIEEEHALELRTRDRERKLLKKIQQSIASIDAGDYGWCEETGEPIGIPRLIARPTATLSLEAQQRRELKQKLYGD